MFAAVEGSSRTIRRFKAAPALATVAACAVLMAGCGAHSSRQSPASTSGTRNGVLSPRPSTSDLMATVSEHELGLRRQGIYIALFGPAEDGSGRIQVTVLNLDQRKAEVLDKLFGASNIELRNITKADLPRPA